jgi:methylated-DNA-protein-cysteine methyltransferase related protein
MFFSWFIIIISLFIILSESTAGVVKLGKTTADGGKTMTPFTEKVIQTIQNIPMGKVATYGQIASLAGSPRAARQVVRILHSMSEKYHLPWHRVVNVQGKIALKDEESYYVQLMRLEAEGIEFGQHDLIDLEKYQWKNDNNNG